jgi:hypothetical protein
MLNDNAKQVFFYAVWIDIDDHTELAKIKAVLALLGCYYLVYSSRSSTHHKQKWRVIIALATPIYAEIVQQITEIINDKFEAAGITPDRASERVNQICYLPNQGEFYQYHIEYQPYLDWQTVLVRELTVKQQKALAEQQRIEHAKEQARIKAMQRIATNSLSPIQAFNQSYSVELCLELYHYKRIGKKYLSPNSQSGQAGVTVKNGKWFSSHTSDSGIGKMNHNGTGCYGDAFDLFVHYEHGGNYKATIKAAGAMFTTHTGTTLTKANQRHYMEQR